MLLLQRDKVTAPFLAERFEVSRRTINRDIEDLCQAGIPIITVRGGGGGISIADGYKVDKSVLTYEELQSVIAGLKGLDSISPDSKADRLISKLFMNKDSVVSLRDSIIIDLSSHYRSGLTGKIELIRQAIRSCSLIKFLYYNSKGDSERVIEPYFLTFRWSAWYVFGYCLDREDFRLFKLNRLWELKCTGQSFIPRSIPEEKADMDNYFQDEIQVTLLFDESVKYRLIDEYGINCYTRAENGKLKMQLEFTNRDFFTSWILGFGDKAEVVSPEDLRLEIKQTAKNIFKHYE
jgi:predicted DNA-binding transcriptional regulator YafY